MAFAGDGDLAFGAAAFLAGDFAFLAGAGAVTAAVAVGAAFALAGLGDLAFFALGGAVALALATIALAIFLA